MPEPTKITAAQPNPVEVRANVASSHLGPELFKFAKSEIEQLPESHWRRTWGLLAYLIAEHTGTINDYPVQRPAAPRAIPAKMTREECVQFEKWSTPYKNKHGETVGATPLGYLGWMLERYDKDKAFYDKLRAYLRSDRVDTEERHTTDPDDNEQENESC